MLQKDRQAKECPKNVFFSPVKWLDPINVRRKKEKGIEDYMLSSPLYFDVDKKLVPKQTLAATIENTQRLINYIEDKSGRKPSWIVFSGSEGFHVYYWKWDNIPKQYSSPEKRIEAFIKSREQILTDSVKKKLQWIGPLLLIPGGFYEFQGLYTEILV